MAEQQRNPRRSVAVATVTAVIAAIAFGAAFYFLDGLSYVDETFGTSFAVESTPDPVDEANADPRELLELPEGVTEEFALRVWQEQMDSQENIRALVESKVDRIVFVEQLDDDGHADGFSRFEITAEYIDGTSAAGIIGMREFGDAWYFAFVSGTRDLQTGGYADSIGSGDGSAPDSELPSIEDVDVHVLNTILTEQHASGSLMEEYASGMILSVEILDVTTGPGTATLSIEMVEDHEISRGYIVAISREIDGDECWFIARFSRETD